MHDGSVATLEEVIDIYSQEKADLLAFLNALTDERLLTSPRFADPWKSPTAER